MNKNGECVIPIFQKIFLDQPEPIGSSVFIKLGNHYFLVSAAHVIEKFSQSNPLYTSVLNDFYPITGEFSASKYKESYKDIGLVRLNELTVDMLLSSDFEPLELIQLPKLETTIKTDYFSVGYPASKVKVNRKDTTVKFQKINMMTKEVPLEIYDIFNFNRKQFFLFLFPKETTEMKKVPLPFGMSGGALYLRYHLPQNSFIIILFGINIMNQKLPKTLPDINIALRAEFIVTLITQLYPELTKYFNNAGYFGRILPNLSR